MSQWDDFDCTLANSLSQLPPPDEGMDAVTLSENLSSFADHDTVSGYAVPAMQWAVGQGFINGTDGKLLPTGTATRCQFAAILNRFTAAQSAKA